ncbi:hypothetical protein M0804_013748 [Polistes exclamans]|nr:hypothetical protein M0804_013748 [Polistes exclamans]
MTTGIAQHEIPNGVEEIINIEPGFGILVKPKEVQVNTLIKDLEYGIKNLTIENGDEKTIKDAQNNVRIKAQFHKNETVPKTELRHNSHKIRQRKQHSYYEKDEYLKEMEKLQEDTNTYSLLNKDPTN